MADKTAERKLALMLLLSNTARGLTREQIRDRIEEYPDETGDAFEKMFERDKAELRSMGAAIITEQDDFDDAGTSRYRIDSDSTYLPKLEFTPEEQEALAVAATLWRHAQWYSSALEGLSKLGDVEQNSDGAVIAAALARDVPTVRAALAAIANRERVTFDYLKPGQTHPETRRVELWGLVNKHGNWYLAGRDLARKEPRSFRMSRIVGSIATAGGQDAYEIPADVDTSAMVDARPEPADPGTATLRFETGRAIALRRSLGVPLDADEAVVTVASLNGLRDDLLRNSDSVEVIEPADLRAAVVASLSAALDWQNSDDPAAEVVARRKASRPAQTSTTRLERRLALIPWLRAHAPVDLAETAAQFGVDAATLREDIAEVSCTEFGVEHSAIDAVVDGDRIYLQDPMGLDRPMTLTANQATSLLVALRLLPELTVPIDEAAAATAAEKLTKAAREHAQVADVVRVVPEDGVDDDVRKGIKVALRDHRQLRFKYFTAGRDAEGVRVVDPVRSVLSEGYQYLRAWCTDDEVIKTFRLDRISDLEILDTPSAAHADTDELLDGSGLSAKALGGIEVTLELAPSTTWWAEYVPHSAAQQLSNGGLLVTLPVTRPEWLVSVVLPLSGGARVIEPAELADAVATAAASALARYAG